jgi:hypothetical protein
MGTLNGKTIANLVSTTDTGSATWTWFIDDDTMATASATTLASSESVKAYVDGAVTGALTYQGAFDPTAGAGAGSPDLDTITSTTGDFYTVTVAGTYNWTTGSAILEVGDSLIAESDGVLNDVADWTIVQNNLSAATISTSGYVSVGAQTFGGTKTFEDISGNNAPANGDLVEGELAINTFDQKLYSKDATTIFEIGELTDTLNSVTARGANTATNIITSKVDPAYIWNETAAALDEKNWWTVASGGNWLLGAINDTYSVTDNVMVVSRTGVNVDEINFYTDGGTERLSVETSGIIVTGTVAARQVGSL